jgi:hypothetical protein
MNIEVIVGILGIALDIILADRILPKLEGLYKFTAGFIFIFGFIGILYSLLSYEIASQITAIYILALIIWFITKEEK